MGLHIALITPSRYDSDGYVQQWKRPVMATQAQAAIKALLLDCDKRNVIGDKNPISCEDHYEIFGPVPVDGIIARIRAAGNGAVFLTGVLSAFFPRALDLARIFRAHDIAVVIGGVHINGIKALFPDNAYGLQDALDMGASLFVGQAEGHLDDLLRDLDARRLKPEYDYLRDLPDLRSVPMPAYDVDTIKRSFTGVIPIETSRGCPFRCTFCCIPNTQGVEMQIREPQAIADYILEYANKGVKSFFLSDDNIARNKRWEEVFDRLIEMRQKHKVRYELIIEADTVAYKIPRFIEKATAAGVTDVFLGLESINPDTIKAAGKKHNRAANVRDMFAAWYDAGVVTASGFIIGFPGETEERILGNVNTLVKEYPGEIFTLSVLTPLPGSVDHKRLDEQGTYMDPDLNNYDLGHFVFNHDTLDENSVQRLTPRIVPLVYSLRRAWTIMLQGLRNPAKPVTNFSWVVGLTLGYRVGGTGMYEVGSGRYRNRHLRRPGLPREAALIFYPKYFLKDLWVALRAGLYLAALRTLLAVARRKVDRERKRAQDAKPATSHAEASVSTNI
ncbi:radical SAM protein [uncultured Cohaesibacter sp.]|uniref:B12-binding domain-containing radical SAM protein n=1 Tax=uncultured Cohaesibacter sp. TaxID=1002546 RepID=UPI0029C8F101|nr:radical SAM protein [uncultured Cohaesibacter sp.]